MAMRFLLPGLLALLPSLAVAAEQAVPAQNGLIGNWKLISYRLIVEGGTPENVLGQHPKGYLILTPERRMVAVLTSDTRKFGPADAQRRSS